MTTTRVCSSVKRGASLPAGRKKLLDVPETARAIQRTLIEHLESLVFRGEESCLDDSFRQSWENIVALLESYQRAIIEVSGMTVSCGKGCSVCCCHWVEDVNSFEAEIIVDHLSKNHGGSIPRIVEQCRSDRGRFERLSAIVAQKLSALKSRLNREIDGTDLLLASFYQLGSECPLLDNGGCMIYPVRPVTCRMYVSFSDPARCAPENINEGKTPTYLFDPEQEVDRLINRLHRKFITFHGDTGLRSLMARYLS
jgi:Fe-S-cluster containining protein